MPRPRRLVTLTATAAACAAAGAPAAAAARPAAAATAAATATQTPQAAETFAVPRIAYEALLGASADEALASALTSEGVVALTGVPGLAAARDAALRGAHECARKEGASGASATFADGTDRATVAAEVAGIDGFGPLTLFDGATTADKCADVAGFGPAAAMLRASVAAAAGTFTERLAATFAPADDQPLLVDSEDEAVSYEGFMDVVAHGAHLEHFHSYHAKADSASDTIGDTIELHTDAGLMIAFVPAVMFDATKSELSGGAAAGDFLVELADGSRAVADFGGADTAGTLVFMIGDGAEAYYNPRAAEGKTLRACPHAMAMPDNKGGSANPDNFRLWYGRMFLPPPTALSTAHGASFGAVRSGMIADVATGKGVSAGVGCARALLQTDATPECADNQMFCWMRCMDFTETVSPEACAEQEGLRVQCASQRDQIWRHEDSHGDYWPTCTNSTQHVTPTPTILTRNATCEPDEGVLHSATWHAFLNKAEYAHGQELIAGGKAYLLWNVTDNGTVKFKMAFDGFVGYLAFGFVNPDGGHNGMNGGEIVMGINDPLSADHPDLFGAVYVGTGVREYVIDHNESAFRWWANNSAVPQGVADASIEVTTCHSAMTVETASIAGRALALSGGNNSLMWAIHDDTFHKGYHGYGQRGKITVDFAQWEGVQAAPPAAVPQWGAPSEDEHDGHDHGSHDHGDDGDDESCDGHGWVMGEGAAAHCMCEDGYGYPSVDEPLVCAQGGEYGMDDLGGHDGDHGHGDHGHSDHDGDHGDHDYDGNSNESTSGSATPAAASIAAFAALCVALNLDN